MRKILNFDDTIYGCLRAPNRTGVESDLNIMHIHIGTWPGKCCFFLST